MECGTIFAIYFQADETRSIKGHGAELCPVKSKFNRVKRGNQGKMNRRYGDTCYGLNVFPPNPYVESLTPSVMVLGYGT